MNSELLKISLIQIQGKSNPLENSIIINKYLLKTLKFNPDIIFTPECSNIITGSNKHLLKFVTTQNNCPVLRKCISFAKKYKKFVSIGSLLLKKNNSKKLLNRSFLINDFGKIIKYYDKIHLFDVKINKKEKYFESKNFIKGKKIAYVNSPWGIIGLTICYDIRFPNLYRDLAKIGSKIIIIPAAFTVPTGRSHWQTLLMSRAIENSCYIVAAAQCGNHHGSRKTFGHSMVIGPWGNKIINGSSKPGVFSTVLNLKEIEKVRSKLPSIFQD